MANVYRIKPLHKKSICWHIELYRENDDNSISWANIDDHYRWGQGFVEEDMACNLPTADSSYAHARTDCGWGAELDDQHACWFEFSDDITEEEQEKFKECYLNGDPDDEYGRGGAAWVFEGNHQWQLEDEYLVIDAPFQVDLCDDNGSVLQENVRLKTIEELNKDIEKLREDNSAWPFSASKVKDDENL